MKTRKYLAPGLAGLLALWSLAGAGDLPTETPAATARLRVGGIKVDFKRRLPDLPAAARSAHLLVRLAEDAPADALARLAADGVRMRPAGGKGIWYATGDRRQLADLLTSSWVAGVAAPPAEMKLASALRGAAAPGDDHVDVIVVFHEDVSAEAALAGVRRVVPLAPVEQDGHLSRAGVSVPRAVLPALAGLDEVFQVWPALPPRSVELLNSRISVGVEQLDGTLPVTDGAGVRLGMWDGGRPRDTHLDFGGRVSIMDGVSTISGHSTHVAGIMVSSGEGSNPSTHLSTGMAPAARLWAFDFTDDLGEMAANAVNLDATNHSYGYIAGWRWSYGGSNKWHWFAADDSAPLDEAFGKYDLTARDFDQLVVDHDLPVFKSAGNDRDDSGAGAGVGHYHGTDTSTLETDSHRADGFEAGYDTMSYFALAKNIISVGSVNDVILNPNPPTNIVMTAYSGWGPVDDGRIKPDVVTNGQGVLSTGDLTDTDSFTSSGTSMASPAATGVGALLIQRAAAGVRAGVKLGAAEMKALLVHGALDAGLQGPDYTYGWGLVQAPASLALMDAEFAAGAIVRRDSITAGRPTQDLGVHAGISQTLKATLVWVDPAGSPNTGGDDDSTPALVNDLDLQLISPTGAIHHPWTLDPATPSQAAVRTAANRVDTVEQVLVDVAGMEAGDWILRVRLEGVLSGSAQPYHVVVQFGCGPDDADCDGCALDHLNDVDGDGVCADWDGCTGRFDPLQQDRDLDDVGDACDTADDLIQEVMFPTHAGDLEWTAESGATAYNIYRHIRTSPGLVNGGDCLVAGVPLESTAVAGDPAAGEIWLLQVAGEFAGGEGPLGEGRDGAARQVQTSCP